MISPRQFYQSVHPDYFSDTDIEEVTNIDRTLLEFHLSTLTTRSQEIDFERFARRLCEKEICPNLLPTTGPTGGGDSKADSETFPVADSLALQWYGGIAREASEERWAFAFSAKADWKAKVQSDIKKISETARGYTKAFFVTNQSVPARQRAKSEDELSQKFRVDVRILDRTWLLERTFAGHHQDIAIEELKVTGIARQVAQPGPVDNARISELERLEARIAETVAGKRFGLPLVENALEAADLCRCLERPRTEVEGSYVRAGRLAAQYGGRRQQVEAAYQWAWTLFWWYEDFEAFKPQYEVVEERARESENVYDLERLHNLWTLARHLASSGDAQTAKWLEEREVILESSLSRLSRDEDRPSTALQARVLLLKGELMRHLQEGSDPSSTLDGLREALESADGLVGFPLKPLAQTISLVGQRIDDNESYNRLFERLVDVEARRESEARAALLLLERGDQLIDQRKYTKAISIVGRALTRLYKHETRKDIVLGLYLCGYAYERIGLPWAARGTYLSGASIGANDYWAFGRLNRGFAACVHRLKWVEARLGRLPHLLAWHETDIGIRSASQGPLESDEDEEASFDVLVARLILHIPSRAHALLGGLPSALDRLGLVMSMDAALFLLGHTGRLEAEGGESPDEVANKIWAISADAPLPAEAELYEGTHVSLTTRILGCKISARCSLEPPCVEIAEAIFSSIESMLSTSAVDRAFAIEPEATMDVEIGEVPSSFLSLEVQERLGRPHFSVRCRVVNPYGLSTEDQEALREEVFLACLQAFPHVVLFRNMEQDLESLFKDERATERASFFAMARGAVRNVLGSAPRFRLRDWQDDTQTYEMVLSEPWQPKTGTEGEASPETRERMRRERGEAPTGPPDVTRISHEQIAIHSPIRFRLWDRAGWSGAAYLWSPDDGVPPILGLIFKDRDAGIDIFRAWRAELGETDERRSLRIAIVRGIDRKHIHAYRMLIGSGTWDEAHAGDGLLMVAQRIHRMDAATPTNLDNFLQAYEKNKRFLLAPAFSGGRGTLPIIDHAIEIYDIVVRNAWEIGMDDPDMAGVLADDNVIIPEGITSPPVEQLQEWKRNRGGEE